MIYYAVPRKCQWGVLLISSIAYYLAAGHPALVLYPLGAVTVSYFCARAIAGCDPDKDARRRRLYLIVGIAALLAVLILLKYLKFIFTAGTAAGADAGAPGAQILVPLGLSYYTFSLIGYMADVYNGISEPADSLFDLMTFGMYAPALVSGPIMKYRETGAEFLAGKAPDITGITRGTQRMLWGFFKKLVIAERLGVVVGTVYGNPEFCSGMYIWIGILSFTFQLYCDFSGLMDIVLGISECFGVRLPENFNTPFFAHTIAEYWRRWHITLGVWFKEYVFYPILRTSLYTSLQNRLRKGLGKKAGKRIATFIAMFVLWLTVGLWHGGNMTYVIGSGLLHWFYIMMEEILEDPFKKLWARLNIAPDCRPLNAVRIVRTFILVNIGNAFFRAASVRDALRLLGFGFKRAFVPFGTYAAMVAGEWKDKGPASLQTSEFLGLNMIDIAVVIISLLILLAVSVIKSRRDVRDAIGTLPAALRFVLWFALLIYVILMGNYGPGYSAAEFIYQGF